MNSPTLFWLIGNATPPVECDRNLPNAESPVKHYYVAINDTDEDYRRQTIECRACGRRIDPIYHADGTVESPRR